MGGFTVSIQLLQYDTQTCEDKNSATPVISLFSYKQVAHAIWPMAIMMTVCYQSFQRCNQIKSNVFFFGLQGKTDGRRLNVNTVMATCSQ